MIGKNGIQDIMINPSIAKELAFLEPLDQRRERVSVKDDERFAAYLDALLSPFQWDMDRNHKFDWKDYVELSSWHSCGFNPGNGFQDRDTIHLTLDAAFSDWSIKMQRYLKGKTRIWWRVFPEYDVSIDAFWERDMNRPIDSGQNGRIFHKKAIPHHKIYARLYAI